MGLDSGPLWSRIGPGGYYGNFVAGSGQAKPGQDCRSVRMGQIEWVEEGYG